MVYEIAVALGEHDSANVICEKLLSVQEDDSTYALLIRALRRGGAKEQSISMYKKARERLGTRRIRKSKAALGPLIRSVRN